MRALLSSVGTRGDVQPLLALGLRLRELGHEVRLCVPPNFVDWLNGWGFEAIPVGVEMRMPAGRSSVPLTAEVLRRLRESMPDLVANQFEVIGAAAEGCDVLLGANAHQYAARSIAERRGLPYVTALYAPVAVPSPEHAPPPLPGQRWEPGDASVNLQRWSAHRHAWNERALERVNANRARLGLAPIDDVFGYNITAQPWLASDATLAPLPSTPGFEPFETGAWILEDTGPLREDVTAFLAAGNAPIYLGFGSMPAPPQAGRLLIDAARSVGRRAIVSRGSADLATADGGPDCIVVDDLNQRTLFPRVAAVVHHGGAGTTATAARAGVPQVIVPLFGDQFYWASRVRALGIGSSVAGDLRPDALSAALRAALEPAIAARARDVARGLPSDGALAAARRLAALSQRAPRR